MKNTNHKVVSEKQLAANRRNAKRSTGPRTDAGRAASKFNAVKHGILSRDLLVRGINYNEDPEQFRELHQSFWDYLQPHGPVEEMLVDQIVTTHWRLRRVIIAESAEIARNVDDKDLNPPDLITPVVWLAQSPISMFKIEQLYAGNLILEQYFREFLRILENNGELTQADVTTMNKRYFPATSNTLTDEMDDMIKNLAQSDLDLDPAERKEVQKDRVMTLLTGKIEAAVQRADKCQEREDRVYQARLRASVLPYEAVLEKIQRYETRLQRQLTRAMTDLERVQATRKSREAESDELDDICEVSETGHLCQTNPFCPSEVRVPPSGGSGAPPTPEIQTIPSTVDLEPAASLPSEEQALRVPDFVPDSQYHLSAQTNPFSPNLASASVPSVACVPSISEVSTKQTHFTPRASDSQLTTLNSHQFLSSRNHPPPNEPI